LGVLVLLLTAVEFGQENGFFGGESLRDKPFLSSDVRSPSSLLSSPSSLFHLDF
jgi:hypothetical protein